MINKHAINHIPNSNYAYPYDKDTFHIYLQTAKNDFDKVIIIIGDPHDYHYSNGKYTWAIRNKPTIEMKKTYTTELFDYWFISEVLPYKRCKYVFLLFKGDETYLFGSKRIRKVDFKYEQEIIYNNYEYFTYPYINEEDIIDSPAWAKNITWYQIFPERFNRAKNTKGNYLEWNSVTDNIDNQMFFGGNLLGIIEKIPYLKELGISGIYFTPMFESPSAHKYDTTDYFKIDPSFGTNEDFRLLVNECHKNNIKVMLDGVFNHCGWYHPFFQDVIKNKKNSIYYDCFYIENDDFINFELNDRNEPKVSYNLRPNYRTFAFTPWMPKLKTSNPIMEEYLLNVGKYWVKEYDIDGWRLDVSNEVSHSFWRKFRQAIRNIKNDVYILGENWEDSNSWLKGDQLDAVMNYEISYPVWNFFGKVNNVCEMKAEEFSYRINELLFKYPKNISPYMFNLIGSHETMRILTRCNNNKKLVRLPYLFIFSFTGSPSIYYGDEIGIIGGEDPDNRRCMIWDESIQDKELFHFFQSLIKLRNEYEAFKSPDINWLYTKNNVLIYQKSNLIFIINNNNENIIIDLPLELKNKKLKELFTNKDLLLENKLSIDEYGYYLLK